MSYLFSSLLPPHRSPSAQGGTYYDKAKYFCVVRRRKWVRQRAFTRAIVASVGNAVPKPAPTIASKVLSTFTGAGSSVVTALQTVGQGLVGLVAPAEEPRRGSTEGPEQLYKPHVDHELLVFRLSRDFDAAGDDVDTIAPPPHTTDHHEAEDMDFEFYDPDNAVADWFRSRYCALPQSIGLRPAQEAIEDVDMLRSILEQQEHRCMSCRAQLVSVEDDPLATHNRLCFFSGNIYCADCHAGYVAVSWVEAGGDEKARVF